MKKTLLFFSILLFVLSCSYWSDDKDKFINTYKEILIARQSILDTAKASQEVLKIYEKNGYTLESFKEDYFEYAKNPEEFIIMIDSARERAKAELVELQKKKLSK